MPDRATFECGPRAPALARKAITDWLRGRVEGSALEDARLLVSELVTNAVRHQRSEGDIEMSVDVGRRRVRVEVTDPGAGFDRPRVGEPPPDALGGRGLLIVDRVAARWGVASSRPTRVWFELDR